MDLQDFATSLAEMSPASRARKLAAVKSLFAFAFTIGYIAMNPARVLRIPTVKNTLAERIISERTVLRMLGVKRDRRRQAGAPRSRYGRVAVRRRHPQQRAVQVVLARRAGT